MGRLARRLDPQVIPTIAQKLGLTQIEVRRVRDSAAGSTAVSTAGPTAGSTAWRRSFQTLQSAVRKHSLTLGDLQEAIVSAGVGKHVMCQVGRAHVFDAFICLTVFTSLIFRPKWVLQVTHDIPNYIHIIINEGSFKSQLSCFFQNGLFF